MSQNARRNRHRRDRRRRREAARLGGRVGFYWRPDGTVDIYVGRLGRGLSKVATAVKVDVGKWQHVTIDGPPRC